MTTRLAKRVAQFPLSPEIEWALDNAIRAKHMYHLRESDGSRCTLLVTTTLEAPEKGRLAVGFESLQMEEDWTTHAWAWWTGEVEKGTMPVTPEGAMDFIWVSPNERKEK